MFISSSFVVNAIENTRGVYTQACQEVFQIAEPFHLASTTTPAGWCFDPRILVLYRPAKWQGSLVFPRGLKGVSVLDILVTLYKCCFYLLLIPAL
jgi:hypothetical protein